MFLLHSIRSNFLKANIKYESILVGDDIEKEEFLKTYPDIEGYPLVIVDGIPIGGFSRNSKIYVRSWVS